MIHQRLLKMLDAIRELDREAILRMFSPERQLRAQGKVQPVVL